MDLPSAYHQHVLPVTAKIAEYLKEQGFDGFALNTHIIAMPHIMPDVVDWISALITMGMKPENIHLLAKQYSQVDSTRDQLIQMGIDIVNYTPAPVGGYYNALKEIDLPKFWEHSLKSIEHSIAIEGPQNVIVMDDGGRVIKSVPDKLVDNKDIKIVGVEQTTNGFDVIKEEGHSIDVIIPSMSALKLEFEPPFIADAVMRKLRDTLGIFHNRDVAVIGIGNIGGAVAETLTDRRNRVFVYDKDVRIEKGELVDNNHIIPKHIAVCKVPLPGESTSDSIVVRESIPAGGPRFYICQNIEEAIQNANYVFGCTGRDIFNGVDLDKFQFQGPNKKMDETRFISVSSGDKEFMTLLKWISQQREFVHSGPNLKGGSRWDVTTNHHGSRIRVVQQGFPVNFDGISGSGTPIEMQLISCFLMASMVQAHEYLKKFPVQSGDDQRHLIMLSPRVQRQITTEWLKDVPGVRDLYKPERLAEIDAYPEFFSERSYGELCPVFPCDYPIPVCLTERVREAVPKTIIQERM